jgi:aryl-alcohol dehydrogenase-like predicted oxidoreductase
MQYRHLGRTGVLVSTLCLGTVYFGTHVPKEEAVRVIHRALDAGINFVDTAEIYMRPIYGAAEAAVGRALEGRRHEVVLATKARLDPAQFRTGTPSDRTLTRRDIMQGIEGSLRRLRTDYVDLYYPHHVDPVVPIEETLRAIEDLVRQGKVRYVGLSNYGGWHTVEALWHADRHGWSSAVCVQTLYNLLDRSIERELVPACAKFGLSLVPYSPLAGGVLTGKYGGGELPPESRAAYLGARSTGRAGHVPVTSDANVAAARRLVNWAAAHNMPPAHAALAWTLARPQVAAVITGASTVAQLEQNLPAFDLALEAEVLAEIGAAVSST